VSLFLGCDGNNGGNYENNDVIVAVIPSISFVYGMSLNEVAEHQRSAERRIYRQDLISAFNAYGEFLISAGFALERIYDLTHGAY